MRAPAPRRLAILVALLLTVVAGPFIAAQAASVQPDAAGPLARSTSERYKVRVAAAQALAQYIDPRAERRLVLMLDDPHPVVRQTAASALRSWRGR